MVELATMVKGYKELQEERDRKIIEAKEKINEEYAKKLEAYKKEMHKELDMQIRGLS
jgi:hypothetical protein